jgi:hypothetical protein
MVIGWPDNAFDWELWQRRCGVVPIHSASEGYDETTLLSKL